MHPYLNFIALTCGYVCMGSLVLSMVLTPRLITKRTRRYPRTADIRAALNSDPGRASLARVLLHLRTVAIVTGSIAVLIVAGAILRAAFVLPGR